MGPLLKFFLLDNAGNYLKVEGGIVSSTATPTPLAYAPQGWKSSTVRWGRSIRYQAVVRTLTTPYEFVKDGAQIVRSIYYAQGIDGYCKLVIQRRISSTWLYEDWYSGELDFGQFKDGLATAQVNVLEGGLSAFLKAHENTPCEVLLDPADALKVKMDGIRLRSTYDYVIPEQGVDPNAQIGLSNSFDIAFVNSEGIGTGLAMGAMHQQLPAHLELAYYPIYQNAQTEAMYQAEPQTVTIRVKGTFWVYWPSGNSNVWPTLGLKYGDIFYGGLVTTHFLYQAGPLSGGQSASYVVDVTYTFQLGSGQYAGLVIALVDSGGNALSSSGSLLKWLGSDGFVKISTVSRLPENMVDAYRYHQLFEKTVAKVSDGQYEGQSTYLQAPGEIAVDNSPYHTLATCGDALRMLPNAKIKTNIGELFADATARWSMGLGIEDGILRLEPLTYWYDPGTTIMDVGEVRDLKVSPLQEAFFAQYTCGTTAQDYDSLNGRDEPNAPQTWKLPITRSTNDRNDTTPYRADMYGVEFTRANLIGKATTDSSSDNDTFVLEVNHNVSENPHLLFRPQNTPGHYASGLLFPDTAFNLALSPKRNLLRNAKLLAAAMHLRAGTITFQTADKNPELESNLNISTVDEDADIPKADLPAPLFLPMILEFECALPFNFPQLMATSGKGCIVGTWQGIPFKGFMWEGEMNIATPDVATLKLLPAPDLDLSKFIR